MYRAGIEGILGIQREGKYLVIDPRIPADWPGFEATVKVDGTDYDIRVDSPSQRSRATSLAVLDGRALPAHTGPLRLALDGARHSLRLKIGTDVPVRNPSTTEGDDSSSTVSAGNNAHAAVRIEEHNPHDQRPLDLAEDV
jgi:hypothetical protein